MAPLIGANHAVAVASRPARTGTELHFAPVQIRKRNVDGGPAEANRRFNATQSALIDEVSNPGTPQMTLVAHSDAARAKRCDN